MKQFSQVVFSMKNVYLILFSFIIAQIANAQISGNIYSSEQIPVGQVIVKLQKDKNILSYTTSNKAGEYTLTIKETGNFDLIFSSLRYEEVVIPITIDKLDAEITQDVTLFSKEIILLNETIAIAKKPIIAKKDTIVYDAAFFLTGNEQVVEDLLKKLPGLTVDENGTIKVGEQEVEKVMIENDDFFEKGYKIVTKNMPVHPIDKVELIQRYSNNKHLKGIEKSDKVALNLKLKEDAKNQWFGNAELGTDVSSLDYYKLNANLMSFGKKNKYYFLTNLNNIGKDATGGLSHLINPSSRGNNFVGDGFATEQFIHKQGMRLGFKDDRSKINNEELISLNAIFNPNEKLKIKPIIFFNSDENTFVRQQVQSYHLPDQQDFTNFEDYRLRNAFQNIFAKVDVSYDFTKNKTLEISSKFNTKDGDDVNQINFNAHNLQEKVNTQTQRFDQEIQYTQKLSESKVIVLQARFIYDENQQDYFTNTNYFGDFTQSNSSENVRQKSNNHGNLLGLSFKYLDRKKSGNLLEINVKNKLENQNLHNLLYFSQNPRINDIQYSENKLNVKSSYIYKINAKLSLRGELSAQNFDLYYDNLNISESSNEWSINPSFGIDYDLNDKHKFKTSYTWNANTSPVGYLNADYILTAYNNLNLGLSAPAVFNKSSLFFSYNYGRWTDKLMFNTYLFYNKDADYISSNNLITQDYSVGQYLTFKDRETFTLNGSLDYYLKFISSNLKFKGGMFQSSYANQINNSAQRNIRTSNYNYGLEFRTGFDGLFNFHLGTKNTHQMMEVEGFKNKYVNNNSFVDTYFNISEKFDFQTNLDYYYFGNLDQNKHYYFVDATARYKLMENKFTLGLQAKNLFNTSTFTVNSLSDISQSVISYRLLPRYIMASFEFRF